MVGPRPVRHLRIEQFEAQHRSGGAADKDALAEAWLAADLSNHFRLASAQEPTLPRAAVDLIADDASAKDARVRTNSGGIRR
jgi:hypothetical protein